MQGYSGANMGQISFGLSYGNRNDKIGGLSKESLVME